LNKEVDKTRALNTVNNMDPVFTTYFTELKWTNPNKTQPYISKT